MKRNYLLIAISLAISLFIYLFFRTEETVITKVFIFIFGLKNYLFIKEIILETFHLYSFIIYSLPEGLWVFTATILSKNIFINIKNRSCYCVYVPLIFSVGLELMQFFHLTHGSFDMLDILLSLFFWMIANYLLNYSIKQHNATTV